MEITRDIRYVGVNDHQIDLFEGQYAVPDGMSYNSYVVLDEQIAVLDGVDARFTREWLRNVADALAGRKPDYLIVQHMEPDHSASVLDFARAYPDAKVVGNAKTFAMLRQFFGEAFANAVTVTAGDTLPLGRHTLRFVLAPMVHWPEVMFTYDEADKALFSADAFGRFGALDVARPWDDEARRYYFGIVGKYGAPVRAALAQLAGLDVRIVCPLHGPALREELPHCLDKYRLWSAYAPEADGVLIAYTSIYGNTRMAARRLRDRLLALGEPEAVLCDLARADWALAVAEAFRLGKLALATTTYNADVFPAMRAFIDHLTERGYQNRTVGLIQNGSWAPVAAKRMRDMLAGCKNLAILDEAVTVQSALNAESLGQIERMAQALYRGGAGPAAGNE